MGILSGLFRTRDGPKNATSGSAYSFFMGSSAAEKCVNERSAMQMTAVYACSATRAISLAVSESMTASFLSLDSSMVCTGRNQQIGKRCKADGENGAQAGGGA